MVKKEDKDKKYELKGLLTKLKQDPGYIDCLVFTLELNKFEAKYQKPDKPQVIIKQGYDEFGFIKAFHLNQKYSHLVEELKEILEYTNTHKNEKISKILSLLKDNETIKKLEVMLATAQIEGALSERISELKEEYSPPFFEKKFDENGMPITYRLNPFLVDVKKVIKKGGYGFGINFKKN